MCLYEVMYSVLFKHMNSCVPSPGKESKKTNMNNKCNMNEIKFKIPSSVTKQTLGEI
jgi:hypothetical protein